MSKHKKFSLVLSSFLGLAFCLFAQEVRISTIQKATITFASGKQRSGLLYSLNTKEVRFKAADFTQPFTYKPEQVKTVQLADDLLVFNPEKKIFESAKSKETSPAKPDPAKPSPGKDSPTKTDSSPPIDVKMILALIKQLEDKNQDIQIKAAETLKAKDPAEALCRLATNPQKEIWQPALEALEKVRPELYKPVVSLVIDSFTDLFKLASFEENGQPAVSVLLWHFNKVTEEAKRGYKAKRVYPDHYMRDILYVFGRFRTPDPEVNKLLSFILFNNDQFYYRNRLVKTSAEVLSSIAEANPKLRQQTVKTLLTALSMFLLDPQRAIRGNPGEEIILTIIGAISRLQIAALRT